MISTAASGTTAWLGSVTTPVNPPEVVVCAFSLFVGGTVARRRARRKPEKRRNGIDPPKRFDQAKPVIMQDGMIPLLARPRGLKIVRCGGPGGCIPSCATPARNDSAHF